MSLEIQPTDLKACPDCGKVCIAVSYWDGPSRKAREKLVRATFTAYPFTRRSMAGLLIIDDADQALMNKNSHFWECPKAPPSGAEPEEEDDDDDPRRPGRKAPW